MLVACAAMAMAMAMGVPKTGQADPSAEQAGATPERKVSDQPGAVRTEHGSMTAAVDDKACAFMRWATDPEFRAGVELLDVLNAGSVMSAGGSFDCCESDGVYPPIDCEAWAAEHNCEDCLDECEAYNDAARRACRCISGLCCPGEGDGELESEEHGYTMVPDDCEDVCLGTAGYHAAVGEVWDCYLASGCGAESGKLLLPLTLSEFLRYPAAEANRPIGPMIDQELKREQAEEGQPVRTDVSTLAPGRFPPIPSAGGDENRRPAMEMRIPPLPSAGGE